MANKAVKTVHEHGNLVISLLLDFDVIQQLAERKKKFTHNSQGESRHQKSKSVKGVVEYTMA